MLIMISEILEPANRVGPRRPGRLEATYFRREMCRSGADRHVGKLAETEGGVLHESAFIPHEKSSTTSL